MIDEQPLDITSAPVSANKKRKQAEISSNEILQSLNRDYAFAVYGNGAVIIKTSENPIKFFTEETFKSVFNNCYLEAEEDGKSKKLGPAWLGWPGRREYEDVVFYPGTLENPFIYNLWSGFAVKPKPGKCEMFIDHIRVNICSGDETLTQWVLDWMADAIQKPFRKNWTALLLQSVEEGTGKGFFAKHFGILFGTHFGSYNKPGQLVGKFNSHLEDKLLVFLDEGSLVEKYAYDFAKSLITEPKLNIEPKGRSIREINSYHRLIVASNDREIIRASLTDRRWCVLRVAPNSRNNLPYFDEIEKELLNGGYEALMHMLLHRQYKDHDVKTAPKTEALNAQKEQNLSLAAKWWKGCLVYGEIGNYTWSSTVLTRDFYDAYIAWCDVMRINKRETPDWLTRRLNDEIKTDFRSKGGGPTRFYELPSLEDARLIFEEGVGYKIDWSLG